MKNRKNISNMIAVSVVVISALFAVNVIKADTTRYTWSITGYTGETKIYNDAKTKDGSGPILVEYNYGNNSGITAGVFGCKTKNGTYINLTSPDKELSMVPLVKDKPIEIQNLLFQKFGPNCYVKVGFCIGGTGSYMGEWSPDCS